MDVQKKDCPIRTAHHEINQFNMKTKGTCPDYPIRRHQKSWLLFTFVLISMANIGNFFDYANN